MALTDNIVAYWKLDESSGNASDSVGSNTLTNSNVTYTTCKINNGAVFNGSSAYFNCPLDFQSATEFSLSYWFNADTLSTGANNHIRFEKKLILGTYNSKPWCYLINSTGGYTQSINEGSNFSTSTWYNIVCTYNSAVSSGTLKIYINGNTTPAITKTSRSVYTGSKTTQYIGKESDGNYFDGNIDEIGVWTRELSSSEVSALYNSGNGLTYPFSTTAIKSINGLAKSSIKSINGLAIASVKSWNGLA